MKYNKGSVLILTVWALSFLTIFAIGLGRNIGSEINYAGYFRDRLSTYYLAKAGINKAIAELSVGNKVFSEEVALDSGYFYPEIVDEASKININVVPAEILISLLMNAGELEENEAMDLAGAIIDWRDVDIVASPRGAEDDYYNLLDPPYSCKDGKFQVLEEVFLVRGMTSEIFSKIKDVVTVYGGEKINVNTASVATFCALGLSQSFASEIVEYRQGKDGKDGTEDDNVFESVEEIREFKYLFTEDSVALNRLISLNMLGVESETFRINSFGILKGKKEDVRRKITCVVKLLDKGDFEMMYWREE